MGKTEGVSILDSMVAATMATVGEKAPAKTLTPLAGESGAKDPLPTTPASFPNDMPTEVVLQKVKELDRIIQHLTEARDALQLLVGGEAEPMIHDEAKAQKAKERAADAKHAKQTAVNEALTDANGEDFPERFRGLQEAAQAATFSTQPEPEPTIATEAPSGWTCPKHPDAPVKDDASPKGRRFKRCTVDGCKEFEK